MGFLRAAVAVTVLVAALTAADTDVAEARSRTPRRITIALTGDDLATSATWTTAHAYAGGRGYDFTPMLARLRPLLTSVDVALCHLETPLTGRGVPLSDFPRFAVPHQLARAIAAAGYRGCSTASNHSLDQGAAGVRTTLDRLDVVGLRHAGTARTSRGRWRTTHYVVGGVKIAHLSYSEGFNGLVPDEPWRANRIDVRRIAADARRARLRGADIVVVSLHWGVEHQHAPTAYQQTVASRLAATGRIDLIVGHHAHVVQPVRKVGRTWVAYGLGNSLSGMTAGTFGPDVQDGLVLLVAFERGPHGWHVETMRYAPTWVEPGRWIVRPVGPALAAGVLPAWELAALRASWNRTVATVDAKDLGVLPIRRARW